MPDIILHHYEKSPYSQKIRSYLGYKGLKWRSHEVSMVPPRAELNLLTGGNRRIPVMQIGADVFLDSNMIWRTLEKLHPEPVVSRKADYLIHPICRLWEPRQMIYLAPLRFRVREDAASAFSNPEEMAAFRTDRGPFMAPATDISKNAEFGPSAFAHVRMHAYWLESQLATAGPLSAPAHFLGGGKPSPADFSAFHGFWWLKPSSARQDLFGKLETLWSWVDRMEAFDQGGKPTPITGAEVLAHAKGAQPAFELPSSPLAADPKPGTAVTVTPDDYGKDPVSGDLVSIGADHITIRRETSETGPLHLHFPRWGYRLILQA
jgi:glutathione S-transferase